MSRPLIILGAGGHAKVLVNALLESGLPASAILGISDSSSAKLGTEILGAVVRGGDEWVLSHPPGSVSLVNAIGSTARPTARQALYERFKAQGYDFLTVIHPSSVLSREVRLAEGAQIMAGTVLQPGVLVGENTIINTRVSIDHDCRIGAHVHIAPGSTLSGGVEIGAGTHVGTGATLIQNAKVGKNCLIGAGTLVLKEIPDGASVWGVPARTRNP